MRYWHSEAADFFPEQTAGWSCVQKRSATRNYWSLAGDPGSAVVVMAQAYNSNHPVEGFAISLHQRPAKTNHRSKFLTTTIFASRFRQQTQADKQRR